MKSVSELKALRLRLPDCVERVERDGKVLLFNVLKPAWVVTDAGGAMLLSLCDGENSVGELTEAYLAAGAKAPERQVLQFFAMASDAGLFDVPQASPVSEVRQRLSVLQLSISRGCNLNCRYCYATDRREHGRRPLSLYQYRQLVDDVHNISPDITFTLTGGEPLLNRDYLDIGRYIAGRGHSVDLLTNGTLITEANIDSIARIFYRVTISIDGSNAHLHNRFRGAGAYERAERAIALLESRGVDYMLSMTVNRLNIDDVQAMATKYGARLNFAPLFPAGNAKRGEDISITGLEYYRALKEANGVNPLGYCEAILDEAAFCRRCKCAIGGAELSVSATGDVYPCQLLHYPEFLMGNVQQSPLSKIIATSPVMEQCARMTVDNIEGCRTCMLRYLCGGACRARDYHELGTTMRAGNFCAYEREAFIDGIFALNSVNLLQKMTNDACHAMSI